MPNSPLQPTLEIMERQLTHLIRLVDDLLDVARISTGKVALRKTVVPLQKVLAASIEAAHALVESREHELTVDPGPEELYIDGDFDRLAQVFSNLISNAAKYMEPGGRISIRIHADGAQSIVTIADTGIGIPPDELAHIFEIFSQVRSHQHHSQGGLGLGLSVVKSLVSMHGGTVRAHSTGPGQGSEFVVRLPLAKTTGTGERVLAPAEPPDTTRRRVLVADDNHDAANSLATLLTLRGHDVVIAYDGEDAIEKAKRFTPDIVMLDLGMPRLDG
jgi:signal transduction histidine kinase